MLRIRSATKTQGLSSGAKGGGAPIVYCCLRDLANECLDIEQQAALKRAASHEFTHLCTAPFILSAPPAIYATAVLGLVLPPRKMVIPTISSVAGEAHLDWGAVLL
jgi:hypothetical protein